MGPEEMEDGVPSPLGGLPGIDAFRRQGGLTATLRTVGDRLDQIYIGHLPKDLTDELLKKILVLCGTVNKLVRSRNPKTEELAAFCFVEFEHVESVWRVMTLMDGLEVSGEKLVVKCPQKAKEMVERWHNNRSFHLHKSHPDWTQEKIDAEFLAAEEPLRAALFKIVQDVQHALLRAKAEKEAEDKARAQRLDAMKARLNDRRAADAGGSAGGGSTASTSGAPAGDASGAPAKRQRTTKAAVAEADARGGLPAELIARQKHRVETYQRKHADFLKHLNEAKVTWSKTLDSLKKKHERREEDIVYRWTKSIPSGRDAWTIVRADLDGLNSTHTVSYICSVGQSPLYDLDPRLASEASRLSVDTHDIPTARYWAHKVATARQAMRQTEKEDELRDGQEQLAKLEKERLLEERREEIRRHMAKVDSMQQDKEEEIDWSRLAKEEVFINGTLRAWLVEKTTQFVGADDAEDMAEYILDQFPPRSSSVPTEESLANEMREFLDVETDQFVKDLWDRIKSC